MCCAFVGDVGVVVEHQRGLVVWWLWVDCVGCVEGVVCLYCLLLREYLLEVLFVCVEVHVGGLIVVLVVVDCDVEYELFVGQVVDARGLFGE